MIFLNFIFLKREIISLIITDALVFRYGCKEVFDEKYLYNISNFAIDPKSVNSSAS